MGKADLAFIYVDFSTFTKRDLEILESEFSVIPVRYGGKRDAATIARAVRDTRGSVSRFCSDHAFLAVSASLALRRKSMIIAGGLDCSYVPELDQGAFGKAKDSLLCSFAFRMADAVFTVDESLKRDIVANTGLTGENVVTIQSGYDHTFWTPAGAKEDLVLTVGYVTRDNVTRKGLRTFVEAARLVPEARFVLLGPAVDDSIRELRDHAPSNLDFVPGQEPAALREWYRRASVYCQLSRHEGIPNTLCEAMLCEAVPVGTRHYGIPTAIGDAGFYVPYGDAAATARAVREALTSSRGPLARARIATRFPLERRRRQLLEAVHAVLEGEAVPATVREEA